MKNVLIIGSGGLKAGEDYGSDYAALQAIKAFKEEGLRTIIANPNMSSIQTDQGVADEVYFVPLEIPYINQIIKKELIDSIAISFGGQSALKLALELHNSGVLTKYGVSILGSSIATIEAVEDEMKFYTTLEENCINNVTDYIETTEKILAKWKLFEYEVIRDISGNALTICNMESVTLGCALNNENIVVMPAQTLREKDHQILRNYALKCVDIFNIIGECNVKFAFNPEDGKFKVLKITTQMSCSSVIASKASGYPLAYVAAKLSLGYKLYELTSLDGISAFCEPVFDYIATKMPCYNTIYRKNIIETASVANSDINLGIAMGIGRSFAESLQKAIICNNIDLFSILYDEIGINNIQESEQFLSASKQLFRLLQLFFKGGSIEEAFKISGISHLFLSQIQEIAEFAINASQHKKIDATVLLQAKLLGFSDMTLARLFDLTEAEIRSTRIKHGVTPKVKQINSMFQDNSYLYLTYHGQYNDILDVDKSAICIIGAGSYTSGCGFDWGVVNLARKLKAYKQKIIIINSSPEAVSTDSNESDKLYFEPLSLERVEDILDFEQPKAVCISVGGQIANNLALSLYDAGYPILGTYPFNIDIAEDREKFSSLLSQNGIEQPIWTRVHNLQMAREFAIEVGFPIMIRPSYVLSGTAMRVIYDDQALKSYLEKAFLIARHQPVVISKFIQYAKELEIDGIAQNGKILIHTVSEHIENAGVHSGNATIIFPPERLYLKTVLRVKAVADKITALLAVNGPFNMQFIAKNNEIKVIECNIRTSPSFAFISKTTGINFLDLMAKLFLGMPLDPAYNPLNINHIAVKSPVFSYKQFKNVDPIAEVEMTATGEVVCVADDMLEAFYMSWCATGTKIKGKTILLSLADKFKGKLLPLLTILFSHGWKFIATEGTHDFLVGHGILSKCVFKVSDQIEPNIQNIISSYESDLIINLPSDVTTSDRKYDGFVIRRLAIDHNIPLVTNLQVAEILLESIIEYYNKDIPVRSYNEYLTGIH